MIDSWTNDVHHARGVHSAAIPPQRLACPVKKLIIELAALTSTSTRVDTTAERSKNLHTAVASRSWRHCTCTTKFSLAQLAAASDALSQCNMLQKP
jgi:hypothetical protein